MPPSLAWRILRPLALGAGFVAIAASAAVQPWPHEESDIAPDPAIRWGRLENGLRYAVRKNSEPAGRVSLVMQVAAGSVHERNDQSGYAHFVEHMMFRGTKKYPATSLVAFLQHEGLEMGADTSAFTTYTSTFFNLDLPHNTPAKIGLGLSILRDFSDGAVIARAEVKREAKVVASERRTRDTSGSRISEALTGFLFPDSLLTSHLPIGTAESVENATAEGLQEFYRTWYRPSRITIIAVGDAEPDLLEQLIRENFASLKPATPAEPADPDLALQVGAEDIQARFLADPTPAGTSSQIFSLAAVNREPDTVARRQRQIAENAACSILNYRLADIQRKRATEIGEASSGLNYEFGRIRQAYVRVSTLPNLWRAGLRLGEQELRRALLHGFTADEVKLQVQGYQSSLKENIRTAPTRQSQYLAQFIRSSLEYNFVMTAPEQDLAIAGPAVEALTPENCLAAFRAIWAPANRRIAVIGNYPAPLTAQEVRTAYDDSAYASFFTEQDARALAPFDYTHFGPPGVIERRTRDDRIDTHSVIFANGVRANVKQTDYEKGRVYVRLRLGRGLTTEPAGQPGLGMYAEGALYSGGLGHYDNIELWRRLAGEAVNFSFSVEEDGFFFTGDSAPDKVERLLQVITAFTTDPGFRPEGYQAAYSRIQGIYPPLYREPTQFLGWVCPTVLAGGDTRYGLVPLDKFAQRTPAEVEAWLKPVLAQGAMELGVAGDLDVEEVIGAISRTLGALPPRQPDPKPDTARRPVLPAKPLQQIWDIDSFEANKAAVRVYWPGVDDDDFRTVRRLQVLAEILNDRLRVKIREELGATYGPLRNVWGSSAWPGYGYFYVEIETAPAMAERVASMTRRIATDIATKGITQDEFERVIEPRLASLKQELRNNGYWTHFVLCRMQEYPGRISWPLTRNSDYQGMLKKEVEEVARRFIGANRNYTFIARPKAK